MVTMNIGDKFSRLTVISEPIIRRMSNRNRKYRLCRCECGIEKEIEVYRLRSGHTKSCGCYKKERFTAKTHGMTGSPEYSVWCCMKKRCYNKNSKDYYNYGARGITVCDQWLNDFSKFYKDMGPRPSKKHSIDRIDSNGDYCPKNCKWSNVGEQAVNKIRNSNTIGVRKRGGSFSARINFEGNNISLGSYKTAEEAMTVYDDKFEEFYGIRPNNTGKN